MSCERIIQGLLDRKMATDTDKNRTIWLPDQFSGRIAFAQLYGKSYVYILASAYAEYLIMT